MDVLKISLEALLQRATNPQNQNIDTAAVEAFCALVNKEKEGPVTGIKLLATSIHSKNEQEVLQTLHILDYCMQKCGTPFQSEVGKFRFLNEMIKLVSPKYLGCHTPLSVKQKVLELMYLWVFDYPRETKIKEAYEMLKKQGVIKEIPLSISAENHVPVRKSNTIFQDDEKSWLLKKLLQSKNPEDLQAANRLIKSMVKEDEKKAEIKSKCISELESMQNNIRLLNEMLESYKPGISSSDDFDLIKELHESCERLRPGLAKLASETQQNEELLGDILRLNDDLGQVFEKYSTVIIKGERLKSNDDDSGEISLLDLSGGSCTLSSLQNPSTEKKPDSDVDVLCDILTSTNSDTITLKDDDHQILKPMSVNKTEIKTDNKDKNVNKMKAFEELDALSENLLKENLQKVTWMGSNFNKINEKIPMNLLTKQNKTNENNFLVNNTSLDLSSLLENMTSKKENTEITNEINSDDLLVDIREKICETNEGDNLKEGCKNELKLGDIFIDIKSIKPSNVKSITIIDETSITVTLHLAKDKPHEDVNVYVVTIVNKSELPMKNVLFRAVVPKVCKVKLQPSSGLELPAFNPFLPPAAITQVMLVANPDKVQVSMKFIVSYNIDDETMTEMGEVESLPAIP